MTLHYLWLRALHARQQAELLRTATLTMQGELRQTILQGRRRQYDRRLRRECMRLRGQMPDANPWTIELTAEVLMARGLDMDSMAQGVAPLLCVPAPIENRTPRLASATGRRWTG
jgi:hypothetical protein